MDVLSACMFYVSRLCLVPQGARRGQQTVVSCHVKSWDSHPGSLEVQPELLIAEPSPQPLQTFFRKQSQFIFLQHNICIDYLVISYNAPWLYTLPMCQPPTLVTFDISKTHMHQQGTQTYTNTHTQGPPILARPTTPARPTHTSKTHTPARHTHTQGPPHQPASSHPTQGLDLPPISRS